MTPPHGNRLGLLRRRMEEAGVDALLVTHPANVLYLCGFSGSAGVLLIRLAGATLFTDGRYTLQARQEVRGASVRITRTSLRSAAQRLRALGKARVAFERAGLNLAQMGQLRQSAGRGTRWVAVENWVEGLRAVKDAQEIARMRGAAALGCEVFREILPMVKPGVCELDLAAEIEYRMRRKGASDAAFETIVASGRRSALPHARATRRALAKNELVVFDLGAILANYCCDLTRTVYLGRAPSRIRRWYRAVLEAQAAAREALRPGVAGSEVDAAARRVLERQGLGRAFVHSLGHGLGLEVHEEPRLARDSKDRLRAGNVVTLEPGVYVERIGGIRIEDEAAVLPGDNEILTNLARDLLEL